jgi:hypothetical protein
MKKYLLMLAVLLIFSSSAYAADVFVDNAVACPGSGTTGAPYCSIQNAFNVVVAGDTIKIRTGTGIEMAQLLTLSPWNLIAAPALSYEIAARLGRFDPRY